MVVWISRSVEVSTLEVASSSTCWGTDRAKGTWQDNKPSMQCKKDGDSSGKTFQTTQAEDPSQHGCKSRQQRRLRKGNAQPRVGKVRSAAAYQDAGIPDEGTGHAEELPLADTQVLASLFNGRKQAIFHVSDHTIHGDLAKRRPKLLVTVLVEGIEI